MDTFFMRFTRAIHYSRSSFHWLQLFSCFFRHAVRVNKPFINFINAFSLTGNKIVKILSSIKAIFWNSVWSLSPSKTLCVCVCVCVCVEVGALWAVTKVESSARAKGYPAGKLQRHFTCDFDFRHSLWLPFEAVFAVLKGLKSAPSFQYTCLFQLLLLSSLLLFAYFSFPRT